MIKSYKKVTKKSYNIGVKNKYLINQQFVSTTSLQTT